ncbi:MAG: hypothetical protein C0605_02645 [Hyphomicrobiales bacterium]|nr:MAG: hypothetical protein C0605_02645 [Hyphomicrobiales bacterium]
MKAKNIGIAAAFLMAGPLWLVLGGCSVDVPKAAAAGRQQTAPQAAMTGFQCVSGLNMGPRYGARAEQMEPIAGEGGCGAAYPVKLMSLGPGDRMAIQPAATVNCGLTAALARWEAEVVQPSARHFFGQNVVRINQWSSYVCRTRNSRPGARLSEHSLANALDVASFTLADGRVVAVESGWHQAGAEGQFLRTVHKYACPLFGTVLGPEADRHHTNHFHLDLGRGGICQ